MRLIIKQVCNFNGDAVGRKTWTNGVHLSTSIIGSGSEGHENMRHVCFLADIDDHTPTSLAVSKARICHPVQIAVPIVMQGLASVANHSAAI